ncbi:MAG: sugar phosphate isomerase/epimerase [Planctomycetes bacterium]|nr:sugar phosphate isomerase/epimerase [Planctomycetota bacterium]
MSTLDRRHLLLAAGAGALAACAQAQPAPEAVRVRSRAPSKERAPVTPASARGKRVAKACMWSMLGEAPSVLEKLERAQAAGLEGVEIDAPTKEYAPEELEEALAKTGMRVADVVDSEHWSNTLSDPDAAVRDAGRGALENALRTARRFGTDSVLLVPAVVSAKVAYDEAWERSTAELRKLLPLAAELKVHIAIENVWNDFLLSPMEAARYVDQFESPWVGWHMDLGNVVLYGRPAQWIKILGTRIRRLHVKDYSRKRLDELGRWKGFDAELGEGDADWPAIVQALDAIGYRGWASAEVSGSGLERLKDVSARMDRILAL